MFQWYVLDFNNAMPLIKYSNQSAVYENVVCNMNRPKKYIYLSLIFHVGNFMVSLFSSGEILSALGKLQCIHAHDNKAKQNTQPRK